MCVIVCVILFVGNSWLLQAGGGEKGGGGGQTGGGGGRTSNIEHTFTMGCLYVLGSGLCVARLTLNDVSAVRAVRASATAVPPAEPMMF